MEDKIVQSSEHVIMVPGRSGRDRIRLILDECGLKTADDETDSSLDPVRTSKTKRLPPSVPTTSSVNFDTVHSTADPGS